MVFYVILFISILALSNFLIDEDLWRSLGARLKRKVPQKKNKKYFLLVLITCGIEE